MLFLEKAGEGKTVATDFGYKPEEDNVYEVEEILEQKENQYLVK